MVVDDLQRVGLELNPRKWKLTSLKHTEDDIQIFDRFKELLPEFELVPPAESSLLGAYHSEDCISKAIREKRENLELLVSKLKIIENHRALILLTNWLAHQKLQHALCASPAYSHMKPLERFRLLVAALMAVTNMRFGDNFLIQVTSLFDRPRNQKGQTHRSPRLYLFSSRSTGACG